MEPEKVMALAIGDLTERGIKAIVKHGPKIIKGIKGKMIPAFEKEMRKVIEAS